MQPAPAGELRFVDTHCHLDDEAFALDLDDVLDESRAAGVGSWVNVGFSPERWKTTISIASRYPGMFAVLGLHPHGADLWTPELHHELAGLLAGSGARAVGEIGIDLFRGETNIEQQRKAFEAQLALACDLRLPAVIHMRAAEGEVLDLLASVNPAPRLLFHSFEGGPRLVDFILESGSLVGVGGLATRPRSTRLRDQLLRVPLSQMVLETDAPYLIPAGVPGSRNTPRNVPHIASILATLLGADFHHVATQTTANAERLFGMVSVG